MGAYPSRRCGQQIFGYYPCNCVEPVFMDGVPRRCVGFAPNASAATYRYLKRKRQRNRARKEGMTFCGLFLMGIL